METGEIVLLSGRINKGEKDRLSVLSSRCDVSNTPWHK